MVKGVSESYTSMKRSVNDIQVDARVNCYSICKDSLERVTSSLPVDWLAQVG